MDALMHYFNLNPSRLNGIITYLRNISKIRQEARKLKGVTGKKTTTFVEDASIKGFYNVEDRKNHEYRELYLGEGDSAVSALLSARNPKYQALFGVMGVVDNTIDMSLSQVMGKPTFSNLVNILGCGIGKDFDLSKLRFHKIILAFDADVDGSNITSLFLVFFHKFLPEIINSGKLYRVIPPLYLIDKDSIKKYYKEREWLYDKYEYYHMYNTIISNQVEIALENPDKTVVELSKKQAYEWLKDNSEYNLELSNLGKKAATSETLVEYVCYYKLFTSSYKDPEKKFKKLIEKEFPEMTYDLKNMSLMGTWDGKWYTLICDGLFMKYAKRFLQEVSKNRSIFLYSRNKSDKDSKLVRSTIGEFFKEVYSTYNVKIEQRFKGLGESDVELLFITTMNPKTRKLYRFNNDKDELTSEILRTFHGKSEKMREKRRDLLDNSKISYADIDN